MDCTYTLKLIEMFSWAVLGFAACGLIVAFGPPHEGKPPDDLNERPAPKNRKGK